MRELEDFVLFLKSGENCSNIKFYETIRQLQKFCQLSRQRKKWPKTQTRSSRSTFLVPYLAEEWLLFISFVLALPATRINCFSISYPLDKFFINFSLGCIPFWPCKEQIMKSMPEVFKKHTHQHAEV